MIQNKEIYFSEVMKKMPSLLGLLDRNQSSPTFGCFDRPYWHYKTVDFPTARAQEAVLTLTLLYKLNKKENPYYNNKEVLKWINGCLGFWNKIQERNGSFNEWYPKESSFVATAFSLYAITESVILLGKEVKDRERMVYSINKAAKWLSRKRELTVQNQQAGALMALYNSFLITGNKKYQNAVEKGIVLIKNEQTEEGWFNEYGGPDIGYLSLTIDYLSKLYSKVNDQKLKKNTKEILDNALAFIKYFLHPTLGVGGVYGSRDTEYLIPHGFEIMKSVNKDALLVSSFIRTAIKGNKSVLLSNLDDRYLTQLGYTFLQAYAEPEPKSSSKGLKFPFEEKFERYFDKSGIFIKSTPQYYVIINLPKGGTFWFFDKRKKKVFADNGVFLLSSKNGKRGLTSNILDKRNIITVEPKKVIVKSDFKIIPKQQLTPLKTILMRLFQGMFGWNEPLVMLIKKILRNKLITPKSKSDVKFTRKIEFSDDKFAVKDVIEGKPKNMDKVLLDPLNSNVYIPSSKYFKAEDLSASSKSFDVSKYKKDEKILIKQIYSKSKGFEAKTLLRGKI